MDETYARIDAVNPTVNALVNLLAREDAMALAHAADAIPIADRGPLHGLPMTPKDSVMVRGFPTTLGFRPFAARTTNEDDTIVARLRAAGALFIGHSNMPEFGLGSNTFNGLFGQTLNPYDPTKTPGGSSGGAAVALATEMLPLADGSDMGGSLRNPASFCNVVGFRPSIGRTPAGKGMGWYARLSIAGPMAKTVGDTTLLFSVIAGPDPADPLTLPEPGEYFLDGLAPLESLAGVRVAYSAGLHGLPIDPAVSSVIAKAVDVLDNLGCKVQQTGPDLSRAMEVFQIQRAASLAVLGNTLDETLPNWKEFAKQTAIWNIEKGQCLASREILDAEVLRTDIYRKAVAFMDDYDLLVLPSAQVPPFDTSIEWIEEINGQAMGTYIDWMTVCTAITVTGFPAISVPAGFTAEGLPVGVQLVGKPRGDLALLRIAHAFEAATEHYRTKPGISATR
jgi:amidase